LKRYADFAELIARAEAEWEVHLVSIITKAGTEHEVVTTKVKISPDGTSTETTKTKEMDWHAAAWMLERRKPDDWGRKDQLQVDANMNIGKEIVGIVNDIRKRTETPEGGEIEPDNDEE
jgi:hypothetical protein